MFVSSSSSSVKLLVIADLIYVQLNLWSGFANAIQDDRLEQNQKTGLFDIHSLVFAKEVSENNNEPLDPQATFEKLKFLQQEHQLRGNKKELKVVEKLLSIEEATKDKCTNEYLSKLKFGSKLFAGYKVNILPYYKFFSKQQFNFCQNVIQDLIESGLANCEPSDGVIKTIQFSVNSQIVPRENQDKNHIEFNDQDALAKGLLIYMINLKVLKRTKTISREKFETKFRNLFEGMCNRISDNLSEALQFYDLFSKFIPEPRNSYWLAGIRICGHINEGLKSHQLIDSVYELWTKEPKNENVGFRKKLGKMFSVKNNREIIKIE